MLPKVAVILAGWVLLISVITYLVTLFRVVSVLKKNYPDYWRRIGSQSLFDPNNVTVVFPKIIFGMDLPHDATPKYLPLLWVLRIALVVGLAIFIFMMSIIVLGTAPK